MKTFYSSKEAKGKIKKPVVALGNFDGVHLAHQKMFELTRKLANKIHGIPSVYTFHPSPVKVLSPDSSPPLISTISQKIELIKKCKMKGLILEPFSIEFARLTPEAFFETILCDRLQIAGAVAGYDFTFGTKRSGTAETLEKLCRQKNIPCKILDAHLLGETLISSTQIRQLIHQGDIEKANSLLGHRFELIGTVVHGEKVGKTIGFPTVNTLIENELFPPVGVYATHVRFGLRTYLSVTNIGYRPTFGGKKLTVETHLLNFKKRIYGKKIRIEFIKKIRDEKKFSSPQDLAKQIVSDIAKADKIFKNEK